MYNFIIGLIRVSSLLDYIQIRVPVSTTLLDEIQIRIPLNSKQLYKH